MKKAFLSLVALAIITAMPVVAIITAMPAHAISAKYRAQLEREHKTQVQDAAPHLQTSREIETLIGADIGTAADYLLANGWKPNNGDWHKGKRIVRLIVENGVVANAQMM